jgi:hypothetical protein
MKTPSSLLRVLFCFIAMLACSSFAKAAEYLIVSGGPALRQWEDLRLNGEQHDRWWANFIATALTRIKEVQKERPGTTITWLVYRPSYERRNAEDKKPYTSWIAEKPAKYGIKLQWFSSGPELIGYINSRGRNGVSGFEYFGHSNKFCFLFDYSSDIYAVSTGWLHQNDLSKLHSSVFTRDAYCKSWGCHTAEAMSDVWKKATGHYLEGAIGKTDYTDLHLRDNHVGLSTGSHWKKGR